MKFNVFLFSMLCAAFILSSNVAKTAPVSEPYNLSYDVYAGGIHAFKAQYITKIDDQDNIKLKLNAETNGFIGRLFSWEGRYLTQAGLQNGHYIPREHNSISTWRNNPKEKELAFDNGKIIQYIEHDNGTSEVIDVSPELSENAHDILSAMMLAFHDIDQAGTCGTAITAFDGKRKFDILFTDPTPATILPSRQSLFDGEAIKCTVSVQPLDGFKKGDENKGWMAVQNHTANRGRLPEIWFGRFAENGPLLPVRMEISSSYGTVVAHLTNMSVPSLGQINTAAGE